MTLPKFIAPPLLVGNSLWLNNATPSLHRHYSAFITTTGCSAPLLTSVLAKLLTIATSLPLAFSQQVPRSTQEPELSSCSLYAERHPAHKQVLSGFVPDQQRYPVLT